MLVPGCFAYPALRGGVGQIDRAMTSPAPEPGSDIVVHDDFSVGALGEGIDGRAAQVGAPGAVWRRIYGIATGYGDVNYIRAGAGLRRADWDGSVWEAVVLNRHSPMPDAWEITARIDVQSPSSYIEVVLLGNARELVPLTGSGGGWFVSRIDAAYCYVYLGPTAMEAEVGTWHGATQYGDALPGDHRAGVHTLRFRRTLAGLSLSIDDTLYSVSGAMTPLGTGDEQNDAGFSIKTTGDLSEVTLLDYEVRVL